MTLDAILAAVADCGLTAKLVTGEVSRCYLYPPGINPESGALWIAYADSAEGLAEAVADALEQAASGTAT